MRTKITPIKIVKRIIISLLLLPVLAVAILFTMLQAKPELNEELRRELGGQYVELSKGVTHYELTHTSDSAPLVLLIPGLTVPMAVFKNNVAALQKEGYSTLRYDFYGRGFSDRPKLNYSSSAYAEQTIELLDSLGITEPIHLIGISLGGAISAEIVSNDPDRFTSVTLIGAAVAYSQEDADAKKKAVLMDRLQVFKRNVEVDTSLDAYKFIPYIKEQFKYRGAEYAFVSLARNESIYNYLPFYESLAKVETVPMMIIWGEKDDNFPHPLGVRLGEMISQAEFHTIPGGGHTPHFGQADEVNALLTGFLNRVEKRDEIEVASE